jgi:hypothetical protein
VSHRAAAAIPLVLIALCSAAFLRAEQLKLRHSAVGHPHVRQAFSPGCTDAGCLPAAKLRFTLRKAQVLDLGIVDAAVAVYRRATPQLLGLMALLFPARYPSYSQSSLMALEAGSLLIGATIWPRRRVIKHHPVDGAGLGSFARAALAGSAHPNRTRRAASHTTPMTVLAELGPLGLAAYLALLGSIAWAAFRSGPERLLRYSLAGALIAVLATSLFYNAYFENPASWILTALIVSVAALPNIRIRQVGA